MKLEYKIPPKFEGDGRTKVVCTTQPIGTNSRAISKAQARVHIHAMYERMRTSHSSSGSFLWVTLEALHYNMTPYTLSYFPGAGWEVHLEKTL